MGASPWNAEKRAFITEGALGKKTKLHHGILQQREKMGGEKVLLWIAREKTGGEPLNTIRPIRGRLSSEIGWKGGGKKGKEPKALREQASFATQGGGERARREEKTEKKKTELESKRGKGPRKKNGLKFLSAPGEKNRGGQKKKSEEKHAGGKL